MDLCRRIDQFHLVKKIGSGYASTVYLATCRSSGNQVAVKLYHKNKLSELNYFQVSREIRIHSSLDHKNIIQLVSQKPCMVAKYLQQCMDGHGINQNNISISMVMNMLRHAVGCV